MQIRLKTNLNKPTPSTCFCFYSPSPFNFKFEETDECLVFQEMEKLKTNKGIGLDGKSTNFALTITPSLTKIFNLVTFLNFSRWKKGKV